MRKRKLYPHDDIVNSAIMELLDVGYLRRIETAVTGTNGRPQYPVLALHPGLLKRTATEQSNA